MKKTKSTARKSTKLQNADDKLFFKVLDAATIAELSKANQGKAWRWISSIKQLFALYNELIDAKAIAAPGNQKALTLALQSMEASIDVRIERLNAWLSESLDSARASRRASKKATRKVSRKKASKKTASRKRR